MTALKNHPDLWLNPQAAASMDRMEDAHGAPFAISSAGRTEAEQQQLIDDWNTGGPENRPPNLYLPAMPASSSPHVVNGGQAADLTSNSDRNWVDMYGRAYGWYRNLKDSDPVHTIYDITLDTHAGDTPAEDSSSITDPTEDEEFMKIGLVHSNNTVAKPGDPNYQQSYILFQSGGIPVLLPSGGIAEQYAKMLGVDLDAIPENLQFEQDQVDWITATQKSACGL